MITGLDPNRGYRKARLWLPLRHVGNLRAVQNSLTFPLDQKAPVSAWDVVGDYLLVPREYIPYEEWAEQAFTIEDSTPTEFPKIRVHAKARLRDFVQRTAYAAFLEGGNGIVSLPCGAGKTIVALVAWAKLGVPALVVVHTKELRDQWIERIIEHTDITRKQIGIFQGEKEDWKHPICIAMIHTLAARIQEETLPEGFEDHFGVTIYDEVHHLGAPYFNTTASIGKGLRWGLSATPERDDGLDKLYQYHIGPLLYVSQAQEVIPDTYFLQVGTAVAPDVWPTLTDRTGEVSIPKLLTWLSEDQDRNGKIIDVTTRALEDGRKILALSSRVEHIDYLTEVFGVNANKIHGAVKDSARKGALYTKNLIFATTQLAKEGLDRPDLDTIELLLPVTKEGMFRQILGRSQRSCAGKKKPVILIFEDFRVPICRNMCKKLKRVLSNLKYPFYVEPA
jgi:superfamily II DNA or RNA helicase